MGSFISKLALDRPARWMGIFLFSAAVLLYAKTFRYGYAWDDAIVIEENDRVKAGFSGLPDHWVKHNSDRLMDQYGYRPVVMTTFGLEYALLGPMPGFSHFVNAVLYGLLCVMVFMVLRRLLPKVGIWVVFGTSMLYLLHPLHVEAVANIKSRDEILAFLFALASCWMALRFYDSGKWKHLFLAVLAFFLGFLSKESAVAMLPLIGFAILIQPGNMRKKVLYLLPLPLMAMAVMGILRWAEASTVDQAVTAGAGIFQENLGLGNPILGASNDSLSLPTACTLFLRYLKEFFWPWPLVYYSGYDHIALSDWAQPIVWWSLSAIGTWLVAAFAWLRRDKSLMVGWLFFVGYLMLYGHFLRPLADLMADRFMLAASLGVCLLTVWTVARLLGVCRPVLDHLPQATAVQLRRFKLRKVVFAVLIGAFGLVLGYRTLDRMSVWKDNLTLFSTDIPHLDRCARCHVHYAGALLDRYQKKGGTPAQAAEIEREYRKAFAISPWVYYGRIELAQFLYNQQRFADGIEVMKTASALFPDQARPLYFLGYGEYFQQSYAAAAQHLRQSMEMAPSRHDAPYFLAWALFFGGKADEAIAVAESSIARFPDDDKFWDALSDFHFGSNAPEAGFKVLKDGIAKFHSKLLYEKMIQRSIESGQSDAADRYRMEMAKWLH